MPEPLLREFTRSKVTAARDKINKQKELKIREWQFNPPIVTVDIKTGKVIWYRDLYGEARKRKEDED